jgi:hypothetical protein
MGNILSFIKGFDPEIIMIDHILVGNHEASDGIDLAIVFREKKIDVPILFFSRSEINNIVVCEKLPRVEPPCDWIFKSYSGENFIDQIFFEKEVLPKLRVLSPDPLKDQIINALRNSKPTITASAHPYQREIVTNINLVIEKIEYGKIGISIEMYSTILASKSNVA